MWQPVTTTDDLEYTVTKLKEGQAYSFQVAAKNEVGLGPYAEIAKSVTPKSQHGKAATVHMYVSVACTVIDRCLTFSLKYV